MHSYTRVNWLKTITLVIDLHSFSIKFITLEFLFAHKRTNTGEVNAVACKFSREKNQSK